MLKVTDAVRTILSRDPVAYEALRQHILNLSAFATQISPTVENLTMKSVKKTTIVVALSRLEKVISQTAGLDPSLKLDDLSVKSPLVILSYEKTNSTIGHLREFSQKLKNSANQFVVATQGSREITIIVPAEYQLLVESVFSVSPKALTTHAVGISVSFSERYIAVPNVIYSILSTLAGHRINILEIVSTHTELTIVVDQADLEQAIQAMQRFFN